MSHIFISYQRADVEFAKTLKGELDLAGYTSWIDAESLRAGESWRKAIDSALREAGAVILIMTPNAKKSEYVTYEWAFALGADKRVIPILLQPTELHPRLEDLQYVDFSQGDNWTKLLDELQKHVSQNIPALLRNAKAELDSVNPADRMNAIEVLKQRVDIETSNLLAIALDHPALDVANEAALELARRKDTRATSFLIRSLASSEAQIRDEAIQALGLLQDPEAIPALVAVVDELAESLHVYPSSQQEAITSLGQIGKPAVPALLAILQNASLGQIHKNVIKALGEIGDPSAIQELAARLITKRDYFEVLVGADQSDDAAQALQNIGTPEALAAVEEWRKQQGDAQS